MNAKREAIAPDRQGFVSQEGREVYWEYFGAGRQQVLCLLNGLAMSTESWQPFLPDLVDEYDLLLFDYPGQGRSSCKDEAYEIPEFCRHLDLILHAARIDKVHLMGISYGGFVAMDFARLYQQHLHTLTLSGILLSHEELFQRYQDLSLRFYRGGSQGFELYTHYLYEKIFGESFARRAKPYLEKMRRNFHDRYRERVYSLIRLTEAQDPFVGALERNLPGYRAIGTPTLLIAGAEDRVILPAIQRKICGILPNARFELIEDAGHVVYLEQPETFFSRLKGFLRTAVAATDSASSGPA